MEALDGMSWRRFLVLVQNLNPYGATATRLEQLREESKKDALENDNEANEKYFERVFWR